MVAEQPTIYYAIVQHGKILAQDLDEQQAKSKLFDVVSPTIPGYRLVDDKQKLIDQMLVDAKSNKHTTITVYYTKNSSTPAQPITPTTSEQPSTPTEKPTTPQQPTTPVAPETPTSPTTPGETPAPDPGTNETPEGPTDGVKVIPGTPGEQVVPDKQVNNQLLVNKTSWPVQSQDKGVTNTPTTQSQLPQTGNQRHTGLIGLAVLGVLFSWLGFKGKRDNF
ncbi:LPXTG cell wall anchor domain-containing protein [Limosilactobacillus urinaemulieris]|uniref:LPXTG cell wall anchor domain-containing protein n=1 Tax=Limosilactobacillus urinaemulieris TaxID=2742600 RepID=UPI001F5A816F|nr:LPXTG cell wall anchor domain-containing protein [Limosilactobacillus urinaemulieris]